MIIDNYTFKESLTIDLKPPLESDSSFALNFGPSIGRRLKFSAKLTSSNNMKSACNGIKQMELNLLQNLHHMNMMNLNMKSATMKMLTIIEKTPTIMYGIGTGRNSVSFRKT